MNNFVLAVIQQVHYAANAWQPDKALASLPEKACLVTLGKFGGLTLCAVLSSSALGAAYHNKPCPQHFAEGAAPVLIKAKLAVDTMSLCFEAFAILHSGVARTPLWSAQQLNIRRLHQARLTRRKNAFHAEARLPAAHRANLEDYAGSGWDRGHMSPAADMPGEQAQYESFSLANVIPQAPKNNQVLWEGIEYSVRQLAYQRGQLYVISGPIFEGSALRRLNQRVLIPSHVFKAVYDPAAGQAGAYIAANDDSGKHQVVSVRFLEDKLGINLFPSMRQSVKIAEWNLPAPQPYQDRRLPQTSP